MRRFTLVAKTLLVMGLLITGISLLNLHVFLNFALGYVIGQIGSMYVISRW